MSSNNPSSARERKETRRYTFVVVPDAKSEKTRTFSATRWGLVTVVLAATVTMLLAIVAIMVVTPVGSYLPISDAKLERQYAQQIGDIQQQMQVLVQGVNRLREYNLRLRRAMGERISSLPDSTSDLNLPQVGEQPERSSMQLQADVGRQAGSSLAPGTIVPASAYGSSSEQSISLGLPLSMPVDGFISRRFDALQSHYGIDFAGKEGSPVLAAADGRVVFAGWTYEDGFEVIVSHSDGYTTVYKHNQSVLKHEGDLVQRGNVLALLGNTGQTSRGPHLHFEVWKDGLAQNPSDYLLSDQ